MLDAPVKPCSTSNNASTQHSYHSLEQRKKRELYLGERSHQSDPWQFSPIESSSTYLEYLHTYIDYAAASWLLLAEAAAAAPLLLAAALMLECMHIYVHIHTALLQCLYVLCVYGNWATRKERQATKTMHTLLKWRRRF